MKYIPADKLIAEIERLIKVNKELKPSRFTEGIAAGYGDVLSAITSLQQEQPEVEFEKAYKSYMKSRKDDLYGNAVTVNVKDIARHFWNKGYNARKED